MINNIKTIFYTQTVMCKCHKIRPTNNEIPNIPNIPTKVNKSPNTKLVFVLFFIIQI